MKKSLISRIAALVVAAAGVFATTVPANAGTLTLAVSVDGGALIFGTQTLFGPDFSTVGATIQIAPTVAINVSTALGSVPGGLSGSNLHITAAVSGVLVAPHTLDIYAFDTGFLLPTVAPLVLTGTAASSTGSTVTSYDSYVLVTPYPVFPSVAGAYASALGATVGSPAVTVIPADIPTAPYALMSVASLILKVGSEGNNFDLTTSLVPQDNTATVPEPSAMIVWSLVAVAFGVPALRRRK